jgi:hypothetical protein
MKAILVLFAGLVFATSASAIPITFAASLDGLSESPANASPGTGNATVIIDADAHTLRVLVQFANLLAGNTASHIHVINGPGDANTTDTLGPVATTTPTFTGFPTGATSGSFDATFNTLVNGTYRAGFITDSGGTAAAAEAALFAGIMSGRAYLNIHTSAFPGGEIRGFLTQVPEPGTIGLLLSGLVVLGGIGSRRRRESAPTA